MYELSFGMYLLYTWCNRFGYTYGLQLNNTPKPRRPGVKCTTSALVCTSCTRGVQENGAICLVVLQTAEILGLIIIMFRNTFPMHDN